MSAAEQAERAWSLHWEHVPVVLQSATGTGGVTYTVPGAVEQLIVAISFTYTASGNAATRIPFAQFLDQSGVQVCEVGSPFSLVATNVSRVSFGIGLVQLGANSAARMGCAIPPIILADGMQLKLSATLIDAADTITAARLYVRQRPVQELVF